MARKSVTKNYKSKGVDLLGFLNSIGGFKPAISVKTMEKNRGFRILSANRRGTRFGEKIVLELEENNLFLPPSYNNISEIMLQEINKKQSFLVRYDEKQKKLKFYESDGDENLDDDKECRNGKDANEDGGGGGDTCLIDVPIVSI